MDIRKRPGCRRAMRVAGKWLVLAMIAATSISVMPMPVMPMPAMPMSAVAAYAADFNEVRSQYFSGEYEACAELARAEVESGIWNDIWSRLLIECLLATGDYDEACAVYEQVASKFASSLPLRMLGAEAYRYSGQQEKGNELLEQIPSLVQAAPWRFSDRDNMLSIGKYLLNEGEDARAVLDGFYDRGLKLDPEFVDGHLAVAALALSKSDYQEAVKSLQRAVELRPQDPQIHFLLSRAWAPSDAERATASLRKALELNPRHVNSLLVGARVQIDREEYAEAEQALKQVLDVNPQEPRAWALRATIAHLIGDYPAEGKYRGQGLMGWSTNPEVDHMIGEALSHHYRFAESVVYQRRALKLDPGYLPARFQLAQDLLRLGATEEGWSIVDLVAEADAYNVVAYNLKTLQSRLAEFETLQAPGLVVRMQSSEAQLYGQRVVRLLEDARKVLTDKYDVELQEPVVVEIFPQQSDFAIRTFGLPGGAGFLGVCFGNLVTANSPASQGDSPANWESVLWHEFCHVVTLNKTKNRMPRWLSEGISVYEELQRDASWGQRMNPTYQTMILGTDFVPLSELSGAFLQPKSPLHLQFAYYESSLAVRYLIDVHGLPLLLRMLDSLGMGIPLDQAFERLYGDRDVLDEDFRTYAHGLAKSFCAETIFIRGDMPERARGVALQRVLELEPDHYPAWQARVRELIEEKRWQEAIEGAEQLQRLYPDDVSAEGGLAAMAAIGKATQNNDLERSGLEQIVDLSSDELPALLRLIELAQQAEDWDGLARFSNKLLGVQPLIATGHEGLALSARRLDMPELAVEGLQALLALDPIDVAGLRYDLASAYVAANNLEAARQEVLQALEETPRYREAQRLLLRIHRLSSGEIARESQPTIPILEANLPEDAPPPQP